nr:M15 family metallopeptidase [Hymenobacter aquaticus]
MYNHTNLICDAKQTKKPFTTHVLRRFAQLMKVASPAVRWGGDWPGWKDRPHFEV